MISTSLGEVEDSQLCASPPLTPTELEASQHGAAVISSDDEVKDCQRALKVNHVPTYQNGHLQSETNSCHQTCVGDFLQVCS